MGTDKLLSLSRMLRLVMTNQITILSEGFRRLLLWTRKDGVAHLSSCRIHPIAPMGSAREFLLAQRRRSGPSSMQISSMGLKVLRLVKPLPAIYASERFSN